jgi:HSP20 family protein
MQSVSQALDQVKELYQKVLGRPAPEIASGCFAAFPPGVDPVDHAVREVDALRQISERMAFVPRPAAWAPPADSYVTKDALVVRLEIPGVDRDTLKVLVAGGECVVRGERKLPETTPEMRPLSLERPWGPFERRFALPPGSYPDRVTARYADGEIEVRVAVEGIAAPKEMNVEVA